MIASNGLFLFASLFALMFAPKCSGSLDLIAVCGCLLMATAVRSGAIQAIPSYARGRAGRFLALILVLIAWAAFSAGMAGFNEAYQPLRFAKCLFHFGGCYALMGFYCRVYGDRATTRVIEHFWLALVAHGAVMLLMFQFPAVNQFYLEHILDADCGDSQFGERISENRIGGLTSSWDAVSGFQSLGLLLLPVLYALPNMRIPKPLLIAAVPLLLFSMAISGTTGIVTLVLFMVVTVFSLGATHARSTLAVLWRSALFAGLVGWAFSSYWTSGSLRSTSIARSAYMIGDSLGIDDIEFAQSGKQINGSETLGLIFGRMYFVPRELSTWLTGLGGSGRNWQFYILEADPGPTLNLHNLGIVGFLLIYIFFLKHLLFVVGNRNRCRLLWTAFLIPLLVLLAVDIKVQYLYARNSFTIMSLFFLLSWIEYARVDQRNNRVTSSSSDLDRGSSPPIAPRFSQWPRQKTRTTASSTSRVEHPTDSA